MKDFWKKLSEKWPIAFLSPMDWYTDSAYRQTNKLINKDVMVVSEFYSADWLVHSKFLKDSVLPHKEIEKPLILQILRKDPEMFAKAAKIIESYNVAWIDINMWCPAKKVVKSGHWSGLLINQDTAFKIVETINKATKLPISVKTRLSFDWSGNLIEFVKWLENAWAWLVTVHWRTAKQAYTWNANFSQIYDLKKSVSIPVICNGDIENYEDWLKKLHSPDNTAILDWFMIWRHSFWNPWCFLPNKEILEKNDFVWNWKFLSNQYCPTLREILNAMEFHFKALLETKWEKKATLDIRKHLVQYLKWFPWVAKYRKRLVTIENTLMLEDILKEIKLEFKNSLDLITSEINN